MQADAGASLASYSGDQPVEGSYHVLFSIEPSCLDELCPGAGDIKVSGRCTWNESLKIGEILMTARQHLQRDQVTGGRNRNR